MVDTLHLLEHTCCGTLAACVAPARVAPCYTRSQSGAAPIINLTWSTHCVKPEHTCWNLSPRASVVVQIDPQQGVALRFRLHHTANHAHVFVASGPFDVSDKKVRPPLPPRYAAAPTTAATYPATLLPPLLPPPRLFRGGGS